MGHVMRLTRRDLLRWGIVTGGAAMLPGGVRLSRADSGSSGSGSGSSGSGSGGGSSSPRTTPFVVELRPGQGIPPIARTVGPFATARDPDDCVNFDENRTTAFHVSDPRDVDPSTEFLKIYERPVLHSFHPELPKNVLWGYTDDPTGPGMIPGPTIIAYSVTAPPPQRAGASQLVRFINALPEDDPIGIGEPISVIHRHGGFQAPEDDGYPLDSFCSGQSRDYFYPNIADKQLQDEHSTNWYHDHAIDITAENVYRGLAGFYLYRFSHDTGRETDPAPNLQLPSGEFDIGLVLQDRRFDRNGFLVYNSFDHNGFLGDKFCVNGLIQPYLKVARRKYRFRFLNGSNARVYQLFLSNGGTFKVIGTDTHLLEAPVPVTNFRIAPAERVDVVVDFTNTRIGDEIFLVNRLQQTDGRKPDGLVSPGTQLLKFKVNRDAADPSRVPDVLLPVTEGPKQLLPRVKVQRRFKFERSHGAWVINGEFFDEHRINAKPKVGEPEIWILESGGGWVHPVHIHLSEFFILSRDGRKPPPIEGGRKDTVLIGGDVGQEVKILIMFEEFPGFGRFTNRFVFHCHNIEHEDMRMMAQFEVQP